MSMQKARSDRIPLVQDPTSPVGLFANLGLMPVGLVLRGWVIRPGARSTGKHSMGWCLGARRSCEEMRVWIGDKPVDGDLKKGLTRG